MNDSHQAAIIHAAKNITLCSDLLHMVQIFKIAYSMSWKWRRMSSIRNGEDIGLYISNTSGWIVMM